MSYIGIQNEHQYTINEALIHRAIQSVINRHEVSTETAITVVFTTNEAVQKLNKQHRNVNAPTDILSFPANPLPPGIADSETTYAGDLIIAYPYARIQAEKLNHSLDDSLALLVIHGTLHLLGYDHDNPESRAEMWAEQASVLKAMNIDTDIVPSLEESNHA